MRGPPEVITPEALLCYYRGACGAAGRSAVRSFLAPPLAPPWLPMSGHRKWCKGVTPQPDDGGENERLRRTVRTVVRTWR